METKSRSIAKALSWRFLATLITIFIVLIYTGRWQSAAVIGLLDTTIKVMIYYFHERLWLRVSFGLIKAPDYEI